MDETEWFHEHTTNESRRGQPFVISLSQGNGLQTFTGLGRMAEEESNALHDKPFVGEELPWVKVGR